jgi:membrane-associated phospholipid phosphatase
MKTYSHLHNCRRYFYGLLILLLSGTLLLLLYGKSASFTSLNSFHHVLLNAFFINYTFMGDGIFALCLIAWLFFYKKKQQGLILLVAFLVSGLMVQIIKNFVNSPRPRSFFFEAGQYLYFIDGVSQTGYSSFPSGHTATAFAIATFLVLTMKNKRWQFLLLTAAALVGYSRIYLAQHFLLDVIIGTVIGTAAGILSFHFVMNAKGIRRSVRKMQPGENGSTLASPTAVQRYETEGYA